MAFDFDLIVIGSGFGATVAAMEMAGRNKSVLILERGLWWNTPEITAENQLKPYLKMQRDAHLMQYWPRPDHRAGLIDFLGIVKANGVLGDLQGFANGVADFFTGQKRPQPLFRYNVFDEADILTASGVGGGSLVYSNVTLEPYFDPAANSYPVMDDWPAAARLTQQEYHDLGWNWMQDNRGKAVPVVTKYPQAIPAGSALESSDARLLGRARFLRDAASSALLDSTLKGQIREPWSPLSLQINEANPSDPKSNHNYCERQGRCFLGCLPGARHTLNKTLLRLPLAAQDRIFVRPLADVDYIEPITGGYKVHYNGLEEGGHEFHPTARTVVLAAGCLGSTEILLRSRNKTHGQLTLSDKLGSQFSTNGDFSGFISVDRDKLNYPIYATRGPINTSHVTFRNGKLLLNVEDAGIPSMFASLVETTLNLLKGNGGAGVVDMMGLLWDKAEIPKYSDPSKMQTEAEMLMNTCWFNCMGRDDASGKFELDHGRLRLTFSQPIAKHPTFQMAEEVLRGLATAMNATYQPFPLWEGLAPFVSRKLVVTHPLGGCPIGGSSSDGVVDGNGGVYDTQSGGQSVHPGLYVADGSIIPGALAVNPTLTIVALANRIAKALP